MKILYIEDEIETLNFVSSLLSKNFYLIDKEVDGKSGFRKAKMNNYDLIIIDINIPNKNGLDICKELRELNNNTPIIFLTSNKDDESLINSFKNGVDDYIRKPFNSEELLLRVEAILRRPTNFLKDKIFFEDFYLDSNLKKLFFKNHKIYLTKKEFNLLELFFRNQNIIISREDIFDKLWDENANPFSNIIEAVIKNIRKKIKKFTNKSLIKNTKGVGYYIGNTEI